MSSQSGFVLPVRACSMMITYTINFTYSLLFENFIMDIIHGILTLASTNLLPEPPGRERSITASSRSADACESPRWMDDGEGLGGRSCSNPIDSQDFPESYSHSSGTSQHTTTRTQQVNSIGTNYCSSSLTCHWYK